jgi:signal transduction histidine kinase
MLQIADRVGQLNEHMLQRGGQHLSATVANLEFGLLAMIALTLLGGTALAVYTSYLIIRLQREARTRLAETAEARAGLRDLSAKLVRAQEDERRALSRELHDEAGQAFSAIMLEAENLLDMTQDSSFVPRLKSIRDIAERGVTETRNMALLLRPSMLDDFGLVPALNWQAKDTAKRTGLKVQVTAQEMDDDDLPEEHKTCIYRVVQEALNNVTRHAQASAVHISLERRLSGLLLRIKDDGTGFDAQRVRGLGLLGMEERTRHLGGSFAIDSQPGRGTTVTVQLPLVQLSKTEAHETDPNTSRGRSSHHA